MTEPKPSILIVDDDANIRETISDNLDLDGYDVAQAGSGAQALAAVQKRFFDVILMDYNLGDATGIEVIKRIREINVESKILMLTGNGTLDTAIAAMRGAANDFLTKPVDFDLLKHRIGNALEKLRLEQELKAKNEQLARLNEMKSKFMSMSSHDLSNALMTLQVSFEMLSQTINPDEQQRKKMVYISNGIGQIARLIEDLVDWAAIEQGKFRMEPALFAPGAMVEEALVGPQARAQARGIALTAQIQAALPQISADKRRVAQVLNNLLENAIRHTGKGGRIVVTVGAAQNGSAPGVRFAVQDSGEGIAPGDLQKIFQSFYQGRGQAGGGRLGLGLSISKEIVESHKGRLWVESPGQGRGATFFFTIPAA